MIHQTECEGGVIRLEASIDGMVTWAPLGCGCVAPIIYKRAGVPRPIWPSVCTVPVVFTHIETPLRVYTSMALLIAP